MRAFDWSFVSIALVGVFAAAGAACQGAPADGADDEASAISDQQLAGDPVRGRAALLDGRYITCGVPAKLYDVAAKLGLGPKPDDRLAERAGRNAELPYFLTASVTDSGVEIVTPNCLMCHASKFGGKLVLGLGDTNNDFYGLNAVMENLGPIAEKANEVIPGGAAKAELDKFLHRANLLAPYLQPKVAGVSVADNSAAFLAAHHDRDTLAWSETPLVPLPPQDPVPVDTPAWWGMKKKKTRQFWTGAGRGDHRQFMAAQMSLCTDSVAEASRILETFTDIRAYVASIDAPKYPFAIDASLAAAGEHVYARECASCHGTYGAHATYPEKLVPAAEVGTDARLAGFFLDEAPGSVTAFNQGWAGQRARFEPERGYVAPPLDGVWATAPYFHNGSVPTLEGVLDSTKRPKRWTRDLNFRHSFDIEQFDDHAVGWKFGTAALTLAAKSLVRRTYDTTEWGYGNGGHTYSDALAETERRALLEYLKTL